MIYLGGSVTGSRQRGAKGRGGLEFLGRGCEPPPHQLGVWGSAVSFSSIVSELEFNVPFQHKHGYIRDDPQYMVWREALTEIDLRTFSILWKWKPSPIKAIFVKSETLCQDTVRSVHVPHLVLCGQLFNTVSLQAATLTHSESDKRVQNHQSVGLQDTNYYILRES